MTASTPENGSTISPTDDFATVVVTRAVNSGREEEFRRWALRFIAESESFANNGGTVVLSPAPGQDNVFRIVQRFTDTVSL